MFPESLCQFIDSVPFYYVLLIKTIDVVSILTLNSVPGKSEERKGYDHLLDAFIAEFSQEDAVCLAFRCNGM